MIGYLATICFVLLGGLLFFVGLFLKTQGRAVNVEKQLKTEKENIEELKTKIFTVLEKDVPDLQNKIKNIELELESKKKEISALANKHKIELQEARKSAVKQSKAVKLGNTLENLVPLITDKYNSKEMKFLGDPIDYICFVGLEDLKNGTKKEIEKVVILDVKSNKSQLNKNQRAIKKCIADGRVEFKTLKIKTETENGLLTVKEVTEK